MSCRYRSSLSVALRRGVPMLFSVESLILVALASFFHVLTFGLSALAAVMRRRISSLGTTMKSTVRGQNRTGLDSKDRPG